MRWVVMLGLFGVACGERPLGAPGGGVGGGAGGSSGGVHSGGEGGGSDAVLTGPGDQIVFEIRVMNYAWGHENHGFFVTASGEVKSFDFYGQDKTRAPLQWILRPSHAELMKSFGAHPQPFAQIPIDELEAKRALIAGAAAGAIVRSGGCVDSGHVIYDAWEMGQDGLYRDYWLGSFGDNPSKNLAPAAVDLMAWLEQLTHVPRRGCQLRNWSCTAADARPMDVTGCASVPDCGWCGTLPCLVGPEGSLHCALAPACKDSSGCACSGDYVCAGGRERCRDLPGGALTCQ